MKRVPRFVARAPLFDRLLDDPAAVGAVQREPYRVLTEAELQLSVRNELQRLLETRTWLPFFDVIQGSDERNVLNYGLPDFGAVSNDSPAAFARLAYAVERTILAYEPRLTQVRVTVQRHFKERRRLLVLVTGRLKESEYREPVSFPMALSLGGTVSLDADAG